MGKISASDVIKKARSNKSLKAVGSPVNSDLPAAKLHSGKSTVGKEQIRRFALLEVDPSVCTPWKYHNRDSAWLNETKCSDLIYSIKNNGQLEPALVREISDCKNPEKKYELIYGVRRWYACSKIPGKKLLVKVTNADDKECMVLMHAENADSQDISEFERAYSFKTQFESGLFKNQSEMAEAFGLTQSMISKSIRAASIMDNDLLRNLFQDKTEIAIRDAYKLASYVADVKKSKVIEKEAQQIQMELKGGAVFSAKNIFLRLRSSIENKKDSTGSFSKVILKRKGQNLLTMKMESSGTCSFILSPNLKNNDKQQVISLISSTYDEHISK